MIEPNWKKSKRKERGEEISYFPKLKHWCHQKQNAEFNFEIAGLHLLGGWIHSLEKVRGSIGKDGVKLCWIWVWIGSEETEKYNCWLIYIENLPKILDSVCSARKSVWEGFCLLN